MKIVNPKINRTDAQATKVNKNVQTELASLNISPSLFKPISFDTELKNPKEILLSSKLMITGMIISKITIIAITPQEFLIMLKLLLTVLKASFIEAPTIGTKLLIANFAVFIDKVSAPCEIMFFNEKINIKTVIVKIVIDVNAVLTVFVSPLKSFPPIGFIQAKAKHIFTRGRRETIKKLSTILINSAIEVLATAALVILPHIMLITLISGKNEFTTRHNAFR